MTMQQLVVPKHGQIDAVAVSHREDIRERLLGDSSSLSLVGSIGGIGVYWSLLSCFLLVSGRRMILSMSLP
jgi:hypothetical protein